MTRVQRSGEVKIEQEHHMRISDYDRHEKWLLLNK